MMWSRCPSRFSGSPGRGLGLRLRVSAGVRPAFPKGSGRRNAATPPRARQSDASGAEVSLAGGGTASGVTGFPSQSDAESWIGEVWRDLLEDGVEPVTLFEGDREVYGPMSLHSST